MPLSPEELTHRIRRATPFIGTLGIEVIAAGDGRAELVLPMRPDLTQDLGHAHGGVIGTLADVASNLALRTPTVTVEYKVSFLRGAPAERLYATAEVLKEGRSTAFAEARVFAQQGDADTLVAVCLATLAPQRRTPADA